MAKWTASGYDEDALKGAFGSLDGDNTWAGANDFLQAPTVNGQPLGAGAAVPDASTTTKGIVELATSTETTTGTDAGRAVTPAGAKALLDARIAPGASAGQVPVWDGDSWEPNTPTAVTKADVGLGNVDNTSDLNKPVSTAQQAAIDAKGDPLVPIQFIAAATTIAAWMHGRHMQAEDASTVVTVPADTTVIPVGFECDVIWGASATANVTFVPAGGVTLNSRGGVRKLAGQHAIATVRKTAANTWLLFGDIVA